MKIHIQPIKFSEIKQRIIIKLKNKRFRNAAATVLVFCILLTGVFAFSDSGQSYTEESSDDVNKATFVENSDIHTQAYGLYIDGDFISAVEDESVIDSALDKLLKAKVSSLPIAQVTDAEFLNEIRIESAEYSPDMIADGEQLYELLGIEDEFSFTFELKSIHGNSLDRELSVLVYAENEEEIELPYNTTYVDTDLRREGYTRKVLSGSNGTGLARYELVYINDELVQKNYRATEVVTEAEAEVVERGVLSADRSVNSLEVLALPYVGRISSYFGWRSLGYHEGIDIVALVGSCYGDDVYASADGEVFFAGSSPGYGYNVRIDHGDGLVTVYAHLSSMSVKEGDTVSVGDVVGQIGTTGRVTGPHLHFEVQHNGVKKDPLLFLKTE